MSTGAKASLLAIFVVISAVPLIEASAHPIITVYYDGWCLVSELVKVDNMTVKVRLLGEPEIIMVTDKMGPVDYNISDGYLIAESLSEYVNVTYETQTLTSKIGKVWTLTVNESVGTVEIRLPKKVWIVGMSKLPLEIRSDGGLTLIMETPFSLDYVFLERPSSNSPLVYLLVMPVVLSLAFVLWRRSSRVRVELDDLDLSILSSLEYREKSTSELRKELGVPKSTLWRRLNRLEAEKLVNIKRMDQGSLVRLTRKGKRALSNTK